MAASIARPRCARSPDRPTSGTACFSQTRRPPSPPATVLAALAAQTDTGPGKPLSRLGSEEDSGVENVEGRALPAGVSRIERSSPADSELVIRVPAVLPDRSRVADDEVAVGRTAGVPAEVTQVSRAYPLELAAVAAATGHVCLTRLDQDSGQDGSARSRQLTEHGVGYALTMPDVVALAGDLIQVTETAEDDALVVGVRGLAVVHAVGRESVINQAILADHAAGAEPVPLAARPVEVVAAAGGEPVQPRCGREKEFVGDRVLVRPIVVPPQATAARVVPAGGHVLEDPLACRQVPFLAGQLVGPEPRQRPPPIVVKKAVDEMPVSPASDAEGPVDHPGKGPVPRSLGVVDDRCEGIRGVPPARCPPSAGPRAIPPLQRGSPGRGVAAKVRGSFFTQFLCGHRVIVQNAFPLSVDIHISRSGAWG